MDSLIKHQSPCADFGKLPILRIESSNRLPLVSAGYAMYRRLRPRLPCADARRTVRLAYLVWTTLPVDLPAKWSIKKLSA
ncbi:MAG: hypothetical protein AABZ79_23920, partial [Pseudomonadota bacterium]